MQKAPRVIAAGPCDPESEKREIAQRLQVRRGGPVHVDVGRGTPPSNAARNSPSQFGAPEEDDGELRRLAKALGSLERTASMLQSEGESRGELAQEGVHELRRRLEDCDGPTEHGASPGKASSGASRDQQSGEMDESHPAPKDAMGVSASGYRRAASGSPGNQPKDPIVVSEPGEFAVELPKPPSDGSARSSPASRGSSPSLASPQAGASAEQEQVDHWIQGALARTNAEKERENQIKASVVQDTGRSEMQSFKLEVALSEKQVEVLQWQANEEVSAVIATFMETHHLRKETFQSGLLSRADLMVNTGRTSDSVKVDDLL